MRRVIIHQTFGGNKVPVGTEGFFHAWGLESSQWKGHIAEWEIPPIGMASDTVAIIELDDGRIVYAYPEQIRFVEPYALAAKLAATPAGIARACGMENQIESAQEVSETKPPKGWRLMSDGDRKKGGYIIFEAGSWRYGSRDCIGEIVTMDQLLRFPCANPVEEWV